MTLPDPASKAGTIAAEGGRVQQQVWPAKRVGIAGQLAEDPNPVSDSTRSKLLSPAFACLLGLALLLTACGSDEDANGEGVQTTTVTAVTTAESEAAQAAAGAATAPESTATTPDGAVVTDAGAGSDAAQAIPGDDSAVIGATPAEGTAGAAGTTAAPPATGVTGEVPNDGVAVDPATGQPLPAPGVGGSTGAPLTGSDPTLSTATEAILSRPFNSSSPWNTPVSGAMVQPGSNQLMRDARIRIATEERNDRFVRRREFITTGLTVNVDRWTVPVFSDRQPGAVSRIAVCRQFDCGPDAVSSVVIPPDACPDPRYDGWMTVIETGSREALDFWRGRCEADGSLSYHYVKKWDLDGPGFQQPGGVSARGSGLPLFAGLITPEEIQSGRIDHALAISVPGAAQRRYVQPASRTDGVGLRRSLPEGARIRLRAGSRDLLTETFVRNGVQRQNAGTIISALERYGAIVVDRSAAPTMYAQRNADWNGILPLNLLQDIGLSQFDVVELGPILFDPPRVGEGTFGETIPGSVPGGTGGGTAPATGSGQFGSPDAGNLVP